MIENTDLITDWKRTRTLYEQQLQSLKHKSSPASSVVEMLRERIDELTELIAGKPDERNSDT